MCQKVRKTNPCREYAKKSFYETRTPIQMPLSKSLLNLSRTVFESDNSEVIECEQPINDWFIQKSSKNLMDFNRRTILGFGFTCTSGLDTKRPCTSGVKNPMKGVEFKSEIPLVETLSDSSFNFLSPMKMWYNGQPYHSLPTALLYADKLKIKQQFGSNYDIFTSNWPMPPNRTSGKNFTYP